MSKRVFLPILCALPILGCGDAATNPLHEGFEADPSPILGTWHMVGEDGKTDARYPFVIERGADFLFGEVRFRMFSQDWQMFFTDVRDWDGRGFTFHHSETHGLSVDRLKWSVGYQPRVEQSCPPGWTGDQPDRPEFLLLQGPRAMTFRRPGVTDTVPEGPGTCAPPE